MNVVEKLKSMGVEITEEIKKAFPDDMVSSLEVKKKKDRIEELEKKENAWQEEQTKLQKELNDLRESNADVKTWQEKVEELNQTLENERRERAQKEETERLNGLVTDFFKDKTFVNEITGNAIKAQLIETLGTDAARGKSISDLFDAIVKDDKGEYKPNILIDPKTLAAQQRRSSIVGRNIGTGGNGEKLSMAKLMKLKNQDPDIDINQYLNQE